MDAHIKEISDKINKANTKLQKYQNALEALQEICKHEWTYVGHGHNSKFYECNKCGAEKDE